MMSQNSRRDLLGVVAPRYQHAQAAEREQILNEFVARTGYHRKYAIQLLNTLLSLQHTRASDLVPLTTHLPFSRP